MRPIRSPLKSQANQAFRETSHLRTKGKKRTECYSLVWQVTLGTTVGNPHYDNRNVSQEGPPTWSNANGGGTGACDLCFMGV